MCVAVPMRIVEINEKTNTAKALFSGNEIAVNISLVSPKIGDYALVHAGCAIELIQKDAATEILDIINELEEITR